MQKQVSITLEISELKAIIFEVLKEYNQANPSVSPATAKAEPQYLKIEEVAEMLGVSRSTMYSKTHFKDIPYFQLGRRVYFKPEDVYAYIEQRRVKSNKELERDAATLLNKKKK